MTRSLGFKVSAYGGAKALLALLPERAQAMLVARSLMRSSRVGAFAKYLALRFDAAGATAAAAAFEAIARFRPDGPFAGVDPGACRLLVTLPSGATFRILSRSGLVAATDERPPEGLP